LPRPSVAEWTVVLRLADMYGFPDLHKSSVARLSTEPLNPIEKLILAHRCHVGAWMIPTLNELVRRPTPIQPSELERLLDVFGSEFTTKIFEVRESTPIHAAGCFCGHHGRSNSAAACVFGGGRAVREFYVYTDTIRSVFGFN
jgi:hypothetical protein